MDRSYRREKPAEAWDAIVIGSGVGGLVPAALLSREGWRVLLLERHSAFGGCTQIFKRAGYEWDAGLHYMGDVHRPQSVLRKVFDAMSGGQLAWAPMPDVYNRIVIGERAYDYPSGTVAFARRMKEYFPEEVRAIDGYIEQVAQAHKASAGFMLTRAFAPQKSPSELETPFRAFSDRTVLDVLRGLTSNPELIAVLCGHYGDYCLTPDQASFGIHAMLIRHYIDGASYPVGGSGRIAETAIQVIEAAGGQALRAAEVTRILVEDGRATGVLMADGQRFIAPVIISDAGADNTFNRLLPDTLPATAEIRERCRTAVPSQCWVTLNLGLRGTAAELGLEGTNLWIHPSNDLVGNYERYVTSPETAPLPLHFMSFPSAKDPSWEARYPGRSTIDLCSLTHWSVFERFADSQWKQRGADYDALKQRFTEAMLDVVFRFHPNLRDRIDYMELATPLSFNHFLNRQRGDFMAFAHSPEKFGTRALRAPTPVPGLFLTGQDAATAGVSGALMGGVAATSAALGRNVLGELRQR